MNLTTQFEIKKLINCHLNMIQSLPLIDNFSVSKYETAIIHNFNKNIIKQIFIKNETILPIDQNIEYDNLLSLIQRSEILIERMPFDYISKIDNCLYDNQLFLDLPHFDIPACSENTVEGVFSDNYFDISILSGKNTENLEVISNFFTNKNIQTSILERINNYPQTLQGEDIEEIIEGLNQSVNPEFLNGFSLITTGPECQLINASNTILNIACKNNINLELAFQKAYYNLEYIFLQKNQFSFLLKKNNPLICSNFSQIQEKMNLCNTEILKYLEQISDIFCNEGLYVIKNGVNVNYFINITPDINFNILTFAYDIPIEIIKYLI